MRTVRNRVARCTPQPAATDPAPARSPDRAEARGTCRPYVGCGR